MINWANRHLAATIALDTPSGLDLTTAKIHQPSIVAAATLTLALPKKGLLAEHVQPIVVEQYLGDISVPPSWYHADALKLEVASDLFAAYDVVALG